MLHVVCSTPVGPNRPKSMKLNNRILWILLALLVMAALASRAKANMLDTGIPDTLSIDSAVSFQGGIGVIPVRFYNDQPLTGIELTFRESSASVTLDSVSFASTRASSFSLKGIAHNSNGSHTIYVLASSDVVIPVGSGIMCRLYYSYANDIPAQIITLDSTTVILPNQIERGTWFTDTLPTGPYHPKFRKGHLNIQLSPPSFDSVWVNNVSIGAGNPVSVDVNLFNERNVKIVELALSYGTDRLTLDSVTFGGTRGNAAPNKSYQPNSTDHKLYIALDFGEITPLTPGTGIIARLHFTADANAPDTSVTIDSTTFASVLPTVLTLTSADANRHFSPIFRAGTVTILTITDVDDILENLPTAYALLQNYPNPFNPSTEIEFSIPKAEDVSLIVYNVLGQQVRQLSQGVMPAGSHRITFDGRTDSGETLSSGMYFYRITAGTFSQTRKMLLVK